MPNMPQSDLPRDAHSHATRARRLMVRRARPVGTARTIGAVIASSTGVAGAAAIATKHGSDVVAVIVFLSMQAWSVCELVCRWRLRWRIARLQEDIARKAIEHPENEHLRTLLADVASTYLDELGTRLPLRPQLMKKPPTGP